MTKTLDPITLEIIANGLRSAADEAFVALMKKRLFDQHQGTPRSFHRHLRCERPADRAGGRQPADPSSPR